MPSFKSIPGLLVLILFAVGCDTSVPGGKVPMQYLGLAQEYLGTYEGRFEGSEGTVTLSLDDEGAPQVTLEGFRDGDLIDRKCGSRVGALKAASFRTDKVTGKTTLKSARFVFEKGRCSYLHDEITLSFKLKSDGMRLTLDVSEGSGDWHFVHYGTLSKISTK